MKAHPATRGETWVQTFDWCPQETPGCSLVTALAFKQAIHLQIGSILKFDCREASCTSLPLVATCPSIFRQHRFKILSCILLSQEGWWLSAQVFPLFSHTSLLSPSSTVFPKCLGNRKTSGGPRKRKKTKNKNVGFPRHHLNLLVATGTTPSNLTLSRKTFTAHEVASQNFEIPSPKIIWFQVYSKNRILQSTMKDNFFSLYHYLWFYCLTAFFYV